MAFKGASNMTKNLFIFALCLIVISPLMAVAQELNGGKVYGRYCGNCHNFRPPGEKSDREWDMAIGHMRAVAGLTGGEARAVVKFMEIKNPEEPLLMTRPKNLGPAQPGVELADKALCRACHTIGNTGGTVGPSLNGVLNRRTREYIIAQVLDPRSHNPSSVMPPHDFSLAELNNLIDYIASFK
jgi:cytochrome c2